MMYLTGLRYDSCTFLTYVTYLTGPRCDRCKPKFYDLEIANQQGCKPCDCHPVGSDEGGLCDNVTGQCHCRGGILINKACVSNFCTYRKQGNICTNYKL